MATTKPIENKIYRRRFSQMELTEARAFWVPIRR
jgi:hypothetical protein